MQGWLAWQKLRPPKSDDAEMTDQDVVDFMKVETGRNMLFLSAFLDPAYGDDVAKKVQAALNQTPETIALLKEVVQTEESR